MGVQIAPVPQRSPPERCQRAVSVQARYWRLNARPEGHDYAGALSLETRALGAPKPGEVIVKAEYLSMDPGVRVWMTAREDSYSPPIPLGAPMQGQFIGTVVESAADGFAAGDTVRGFGQWADHSLVDATMSGLSKLDPDVRDVRDHFGALGLNGWTALCGLRDVLNLQGGETVLVSAAAGATGSVACQIARNMGCTVIGIAGSDAKCAYLTGTLGIARAINYKREDVAAALARIEGGINVYFENVGGALLDAALPNMAMYGRIGICGLIEGYTSDSGLPGPARFDQILMKRLTVSGIFLPDFMMKGIDYYPPLKQWYDAGKLRLDFDETRGLENVLVAFTRLMTGQNTGKVIVDIR
ncbi:MAG: NADP-dependent oxidoreductase [Alphaproteobacteria bacterium]|nr:NADP-dependent oxidoreductase [Alphaproteobacteria bacterium]MDE2041720.1 NADP-dependent oxidoreductase [Alphaproteobacteria bacterium]MDE2340121.1 NADP-dependent oxidoreductase [Alphaproteobacteria bacterium]